MIIILKSDAYEPLSLYIHDFLVKYKPSSSLKNKEQVFTHIRELLPKITTIKNQKITL